jgi:hypothetical protein
LNLVKGFEMPAHEHADLMLQYAQDAMETETPWERWEIDASLGWVTCLYPIQFFPEYEYRRKPKVIIINGIGVPLPMRVAPPAGTMIYYVDTANLDLWNCWRSVGSTAEQQMIDNGICHLSKEACLKHAEALLSFTKQD